MEDIASTQALPSDIVTKNVPAPVPRKNLSFSLIGATGRSYKSFITDLRNALTIYSNKVYNIPVLPARVEGSARFILVDLTNYQSEMVTIAIDMINSYVVAYRARNTAYFLDDIPREAKQVLFSGINSVQLPYKGSYDDLERHASNTRRENIDLGFSEIGSSIGNMFHYNSVNSVPRAFIVILQSVAEAARFKYIEKVVSDNVTTKFRPDPAFLSLQNRWSNLSDQIQLAQNNNGKFVTPVPVRSVSNKIIMVEDVNSEVVKGIALLLRLKGNQAMNLTMMEDLNGSQWEYARGEFGVDF